MDDSKASEFFQVAGEVGRVCRKVLGGGELARVDVDGYDGEVGEGVGGADEGEVPVMKEAHGRDESHRLALRSTRPRPRPHRRLIPYQLRSTAHRPPSPLSSIPPSFALTFEFILLQEFGNFSFWGISSNA